METYNGNPSNYPAGLSLPQDGVDKRNVLSVRAGLEGLADRTEFLRTHGPSYGQFVVSANPFAQPAASWQYGTVAPGVISAADESAVQIWWPLDMLPHGATIKTYGVTIDPPFHGSLPGAQPTISIQRTRRTTQAVDTWHSWVDNQANAADYSARHAVTPGTISLGLVDRNTYAYWFVFVCESGINKLLFGLTVGPPYVELV